MNTSSHPCLFGFLKKKNAICLLFQKKTLFVYGSVVVSPAC